MEHKNIHNSWKFGWAAPSLGAARFRRGLLSGRSNALGSLGSATPNKQQIDRVVFAADHDALLPRNEGGADAKFHQESLYIARLRKAVGELLLCCHFEG